MSDENGLDRESFNKNYVILRQTAGWLSKQGEPDIDQLVPKVEPAMQAYAIYKVRLDKVQETLGHYLGQSDEEVDESRPPAPRERLSRRQGHPPDGDDEAGDVAF